MDLDPQRDELEMVNERRREEAEHHLGLITHYGRKKLGYHAFKKELI